MSSSIKYRPVKLVPSTYGKWVLGSDSIALLRHDQLTIDGDINIDSDNFFKQKGMYDIPTLKKFELTVLTTTDCNLGCGYCFQNTSLNPDSPFTPNRITKVFLSKQTIDGIITFVRNKMIEVGIETSSLILFGGEPLLNTKACISLMTASESINCDHISMITNGVLLKPDIAYELKLAKLKNIQLTLDGSSEFHDKVRVNHAGRGTFNTILNNAVYIVENDLFHIQFRVNVTKDKGLDKFG